MNVASSFLKNAGYLKLVASVLGPAVTWITFYIVEFGWHATLVYSATVTASVWLFSLRFRHNLIPAP